MSQAVVITGVGRDRVGIVAELTDGLFELGCNLLDSSMTLLRGEFAIILMVTLPEGMPVDLLTERLEPVQKRIGFSLHTRLLAEDELETKQSEDPVFIVSVYGADKPGIVSAITGKLASLGANITDVQTSRSSETQSIFIMVLEIRVPERLSLSEVTTELQQVASQLAVDVSVRELDVVEL